MVDQLQEGRGGTVQFTISGYLFTASEATYKLIGNDSFDTNELLAFNISYIMMLSAALEGTVRDGLLNYQNSMWCSGGNLHGNIASVSIRISKKLDSEIKKATWNNLATDLSEHILGKKLSDFVPSDTWKSINSLIQMRNIVAHGSNIVLPAYLSKQEDNSFLVMIDLEDGKAAFNDLVSRDLCSKRAESIDEIFTPKVSEHYRKMVYKFCDELKNSEAPQIFSNGLCKKSKNCNVTN
jgi:hypothetical protein